jgi:hypothetical protein
MSCAKRDTCFPQFQPWRERRWRAGAGWRSSNPTYVRGGRGTIAHQKQLRRRGANQLQPGSRAALGGARSGEQAAVAEPPEGEDPDHPRA